MTTKTKVKSIALISRSIDHLEQSINSINSFDSINSLGHPSKIELNVALIKMDMAKRILSEELLHLRATPVNHQ